MRLVVLLGKTMKLLAKIDMPATWLTNFRTSPGLKAVILITLAWCAPTLAQDRIIIDMDRGGSLEIRLAEIADLRRSGQSVEISGECDSACTMYLGLPQTCVHPSAILGFHGPQSQMYGIGLPPDEFEYWSQIMGSHYPPTLRRWYLSKGRNLTVGIYQIRGPDLIRMGARPCS